MTVRIIPKKAHSIHAGKYEPKIFCVGALLHADNVIKRLMIYTSFSFSNIIKICILRI